jgi:signal transduction histidine kinase/DNA-binding NarL/FixJ family response regulator
VFKVLTCIRQEHDFRLVLVAALVCLLATATTVWLYSRTLRQHGSWRLGWAAVTGTAAGSGVWATHFIAMLAYGPELQTGYDLGGTALSLALAIASTTAGFAIAARWRGRLFTVLGGAVVGGGVGLMHFVGMAAFRPRGEVIWDPPYVVASLIIGISLAAAALVIAGPRPGWRRGAAAALTQTASICGLHFTAMAAASVLPDPYASAPAELAARPVLAAMVLAVAVLILASAVLIAVFEAAHHRDAVNKLRIATDAMPAALAVYDADDRLVVWNGAFQRLRPSFADLLRPGLTFAELAAAQGYDEAWIGRRVIERREGRPIEMEVADGRWARIENMATADGGLITVGVDVTEMKRHANALAEALEQAEVADRAKAEFLANVSHEIRTPLNGVVGAANVLASAGLTGDQSELLSVIRASAETLDALLGKILDLSRLESGQMQAHSAIFHLADAIRAVADLHRPAAEQAGIELRLELRPDASVEVEGDVERIRRILADLLSNAIKFTDHGQVTVRAGALDETRFRLEVEDTGIGFDTAHKEALFERFSQADGSATRRHGGAGLGLALASEYAGLLGATLTCESTPGKGSVFSLDVPLKRIAASAAAVAPSARTDAGPAAGPPCALVVDDNPMNRKVLELILRQLEFEFVPAENGQLALDAFEERRFDVILMDVQMPVMDGLTATREIRRRELQAARAKTPVIVVSANCMPEHVEAALQAGAERCLAKPIDVAELTNALEAVLPASGGIQSASAPRTKSGDGDGPDSGKPKADQRAA